MKKSIFAFVLIFPLLLSGCGEGELLAEPTVPVITENTVILPENVIQIGESFGLDASQQMPADGHFTCTVTNVWVVTEESQCPSKEAMDEHAYVEAYVDGEPKTFEYEEWFTEGGAWDYGARIVMVDLTVTNVDAVAWLDDGTFSSSCGFYFHDYAFASNYFVNVVDLSELHGMKGDEYCYAERQVYFSRKGEYIEATGLTEEEVIDSLNDDNYAIMVKPGETVSFTLGFAVDGEEDGKPADLSMRWLVVSTEHGKILKKGTFIDTKLENEA